MDEDSNGEDDAELMKFLEEFWVLQQAWRRNKSKRSPSSTDEVNSRPSTSTRGDIPSKSSAGDDELSKVGNKHVVLPPSQDNPQLGLEQQQSTETKAISNETNQTAPDEKCCPTRFETYKKQPGTKDLGREFEQAMCGLYALRLAISDEVKSFQMTTNNANDGKFDDIGLTITPTSGTSLRFLFQLKHKESKKVKLSDLKSESSKSDFGVKTYLESIAKMGVGKDTVCVLSTNSATKLKGKIQLTKDINLEQRNRFEFGDFLVNTKDGQKNAIFEVESKDLKRKFYLLTSQLNVKRTEEKVDELLKSLFNCEVHSAFTSYMRHWWLGNFILTKHDIIAKISQLAFSPHLKILSDRKCNQKTENLKEAIMNFPLTITEECDEDIVKDIWKSEKSWTDEEFSKARTKFGMRAHDQNTILWYLGKLPLVVKVDGSNEATIKSVVNLLGKSPGDKRVVLIGNLSKNDFQQLDTLETLWDVVTKCKTISSGILQNFNISLQGRDSITLEELFKIDEDTARLIGTRELLEMSQRDHLAVGNEKEDFCQSELHVPRRISPILVKTEEVLSSHQMTSYHTLVIVNCDQQFARELSETVDTVELSDYINTTPNRKPSNSIVVSTVSKCTNLQFETLCRDSKKPNVYLLQQFDDRDCILLLRTGRRSFSDHTDASRSVKESDIFEYYDNHRQVICAPPGMGKSTLMKVLHNTCPPDCLSVYINLTNHNSFLATEPDSESMLRKFLQIDGTDCLFAQLKVLFWPKKKIYLFLDGLDEVNGQYVEDLLNFVKLASREGKIWLSSRENLRETICQRLNVLPIDIKELDRDEQFRYISLKLKNQYRCEEIENIASAVSNSVDLNNSQHLLGIPLQLHIITEIFLHDRRVYKRIHQKDLFILTQMYRIFFEGQIRFAHRKLVDEHLERQLGHVNYILQGYELPALKACLDEEDFSKLHLNLDTKDARDFIQVIKSEGDKNGIISKTNDNEAIFAHQAYAEYFACVYFRRNPHKVVLLKDTIFTKRYDSLRRILDLMLAERNPLHLAVIYEDVEYFQKHIKHINLKDEAGRSVFHLAFSYAQKYPPTSVTKNNYIVGLRTLHREKPSYINIIEGLLQVGRVPNGTDDLFGFDCVDYALQSDCLYPLEKLLEKNLLSFDRIKQPLRKYFDVTTFSYFLAQLGYPNLLSEIIKDHHHLLKDENLLRFAIRGCSGSLPQDGNVETVRILVEKFPLSNDRKRIILEQICREKCFNLLEILIGNGARCGNGNTILHGLAESCPEIHHGEILETIKKFNINVNIRNVYGLTALHGAAKSADLRIVQVLVESGTEMQILDRRGQSVLHYAASNHRQDVMELLLNKQVPVDGQDEDGITPLHLASKNGKTENVKVLLKHGANLNLTDNKRHNALHYAMMATCPSEDTIELLISKGIDVNGTNQDGVAPIYFAHMVDKIKIANLLSQSGARFDINTRFKNGETLLHKVCKDRGCYTSMQLLERGADPNILDDDNRNPLYYYFKSMDDKQNLLHAMMEHDLDPNARYRDGQTLLHMFGSSLNEDYHRDDQLLRFLVEKGADVNILDANQRSPLQTILSSLQEKLTLLSTSLLERCHLPISIQHEHEDALQFGCERCYYAFVEALMKIPPGEDAAEIFRKLWGESRRIEVFLKHVLDTGFDSNNTSTVVHIVARFIIFETINYLIEKGARIYTVDVFKKTPLHYAFQWKGKYPEMANLLIMRILMEDSLNCTTAEDILRKFFSPPVTFWLSRSE